MIAFLNDSACVDSTLNIEIGITESQFDQIINDLNLSHSKKQNQAVRLYLERLRHGHTFKHMAFQHNCHCKPKTKNTLNLISIHCHQSKCSTLMYACSTTFFLLAHAF